MIRGCSNSFLVLRLVAFVSSGGTLRGVWAMALVPAGDGDSLRIQTVISVRLC